MYCCVQLCVNQYVGMLEYVHHQDSVHAEMDGLEVDVIFVSYMQKTSILTKTFCIYSKSAYSYFMYMHTNMYIHVQHTHTRAHTYTHMHVHTYAHMCTHAHTHTHKHTHSDKH